ncbi:MAG: hypothetical protein ACE5GV_05775 [Candidatus Scalindua sp.]
MPEIEERQAKIEGILEQIDKRLSSLENEFRNEIPQIRNEISQIRNEMTSLFKWSIGIMITMWITIIVTILFKT